MYFTKKDFQENKPEIEIQPKSKVSKMLVFKVINYPITATSKEFSVSSLTSKRQFHFVHIVPLQEMRMQGSCLLQTSKG